MNESGARLLCEALQHSNIHHVFGLPGTQTTALFESLRTSGLHTIVATTELSAAMMANGYYRASGNPAVLLTIPGPGFTWALTGLAEAALDSAALLHVTCAPAISPGRAFQLQAIDQAAIAGPVCRRVITIECANEIQAAIVSARAECVAGEPGPVLIQVSKNVWRENAPGPRAPAPQPPATASAAEVEAVAVTLGSAVRTVLLLGQGCHGAAELALELAEHLKAAVFTTTSGRGVVPEDHPLSLAFDSGNGAENFNALIEASDAVLAIGCKFSHNGARGFRLRIPPEKLIHVDAAAGVLGANYPARIAIRADAQAFLAALLQRLRIDAAEARGFAIEEIAQWRERCRTEKLEDLIEPRIHGVAGGTPAAFFAALRRVLPRESILVTDSGQHQDLTRRHFPVWCPRGLIIPTNLQSMGFGIGAAIGAKLAAPERPVVALIGDGGLAMSGLELLTAVRENLDLTIIVLADGAYGAIRNQQLAAYGRASGTLLTEPDSEALAAAIGATYVRLQGDAEGTLRVALGTKGVTLVEVRLGDSLPMRWSQAKGIARKMLGRTG
ncbi:MAG TPA: thiamine pyrophosphate-binding protein [Rhodanobacteraceae bacterium]